METQTLGNWKNDAFDWNPTRRIVQEKQEMGKYSLWLREKELKPSKNSKSRGNKTIK